MLHGLTATQACLPPSVGLLQIAMLQQACSSWGQQPGSPAAVKLEPGKPEAAAPAAAACAARPAAAAATNVADAAGAAAAETASPPHASAADAPPASGEHAKLTLGCGVQMAL